MTTKLIVSVKDVNSIATIVYFCKERKRICRDKFKQVVAEFIANKRKLK